MLLTALIVQGTFENRFDSKEIEIRESFPIQSWIMVLKYLQNLSTSLPVPLYAWIC